GPGAAGGGGPWWCTGNGRDEDRGRRRPSLGHTALPGLLFAERLDRVEPGEVPPLEEECHAHAAGAPNILRGVFASPRRDLRFEAVVVVRAWRQVSMLTGGQPTVRGASGSKLHSPAACTSCK